MRTQSDPSYSSMLKISWSIELESSTTTTISVCGLKYVPGLSSMSSTSTMRVSMSAIPARSYLLGPAGRWLLSQVLQLAQLALHLPVHVERVLALADAPLVPRDHELAYLLGQPTVDARGPSRLLGEEAVEFGVDVEGRLASGFLAVGLRLEQLADLGLSRLGPALGVAVRELR